MRRKDSVVWLIDVAAVAPDGPAQATRAVLGLFSRRATRRNAA
ncbi:MAG: hypothetical protein QOF53_3581 [Nocardioidaceae bacterium]|nr:hypothetical protein [Nocardioidaceae bacterium]